MKELHIKVDGLADGISNVEDGIQELKDLIIDFGRVERKPDWAPRPKEIRIRIPLVPALEIKSIDSLDHRLRNQLRDDRGVELKDIPLSELTKSVVWWLEKVCFQDSKAFQSYLTSRGLSEPDR